MSVALLRTDAIFILSPLPRCGTNFLWDLLRLHPELAAGRSPVWEDYLLENARPLERFSRQAQASWDPVWGSTEHLRSHLIRCLGDGVLSFMSIDPSKRLITKSPSVENLDLFFDLFPDAQLLLLVRDGRDVVESGMRTFGWSFEGGARGWARGVDRLMCFDRVQREGIDRHRILKYEDLVTDTPGAVKELLEFLDLPVEDYPFERAERLPVRGSSRFLGGRKEIHWDPVPRDDSFAPAHRWHSWDDDLKGLFEALAGPQLRALGYRTDTARRLNSSSRSRRISHMPITPDTKDWSWVLKRVCPECGFDVRTFPREAIAEMIRRNGDSWRTVLAHPKVRLRPSGDTWSALEYACHVRDVFRLYDRRLRMMLEQDDAHYPDWDQDAAAVEAKYGEQDPEAVEGELRDAAAKLAESFDGIHGRQWDKTGTRSDGAVFTTETFARYMIHDPVHHLFDVDRGFVTLASRK